MTNMQPGLLMVYCTWGSRIQDFFWISEELWS